MTLNEVPVYCIVAVSLFLCVYYWFMGERSRHILASLIWIALALVVVCVAPTQWFTWGVLIVFSVLCLLPS